MLQTRATWRRFAHCWRRAWTSSQQTSMGSRPCTRLLNEVWTALSHVRVLSRAGMECRAELSLQHRA